MDVILSTLKSCISRVKNRDLIRDESNDQEKSNANEMECIKLRKTENKLEIYEGNSIQHNKKLTKIEEEKKEEVPEIKIENKLDEGDKLLIDQKFIRLDEVNIINFSKNGIINFISSFDADLQPPWIHLYDKNNLVLHYRKGSPLNNSLLLGKCKYTINKSVFKETITLDKLVQFIYDPEKRKAWDLNIKEYKIYESGENYAIFKFWMHSPIFFISEREVIDKRILFFQNGVSYNLTTSVDNYVETNPEVVRCQTFINSMIISEDENNFYLNSLNQLDPKVFNTN